MNVLIVDDEEEITVMMQRMLASNGYTVDTYNNSLDALEAFRGNPQNYDLLISDLTMPNMSGIELLQEIQKIKLGFPTIIMTGYGGEKLTLLPEHQVILHKPLRWPIVAATIRNILDH